ncbi:helix-turn-helix transcriptional regulator [Chitinophaga nivalis]|uniref:AraC family transcriptional regulator n=1 Tax=Chitinophaga nivalis TaxID=2991709 RepID=A0ABT3IJC9_9BACT|nr:AraC family transcriptional regulator [Chitinophaga nivalis]MCW3466239.1 AraC family transcriptional regulator [Chitinophaga nivalis]MCW3484070.1 AraC family transcriptional regulator [Chitinophaga nivalis]
MYFIIPQTYVPGATVIFKQEITDPEILRQTWPLPDGWLIKERGCMIRVQELTELRFRLMIVQLETTTAITLQCHTDRKGWLFNYILKATETPVWSVLPAVENKAGMVSLVGLPPRDFNCAVEPGEYLMILLWTDHWWLPDLSRYFPLLVANMLQPQEKGEQTILDFTYPITSDCKLCLQQILYCREPESIVPAYMHIKVRELLFEFNKTLLQATGTIPADQNQEDMLLLQQITGYLEKNLHKHITAENILKAFSISEYRLKKICRLGDTSFTTLLTDTRMKKAMYLLKHTEVKVAVIGKEVGYSSASRFNSTFCKYFGITPGSVRKKIT